MGLLEVTVQLNQVVIYIIPTSHVEITDYNGVSTRKTTREHYVTLLSQL